ncbi:MAG: hypothetical protein ACXQTW_00290 [Candidatus Methanospirareceae archaeon]
MQKEAKLVNEWLSKFHPTALQWRRVRLGEYPTKEIAAIYKVTLRWADAIFVEGGVVHIVEAKLKPDAGAISQLELYDSLFPRTPEYTAFKDLPRKLVFLTTRMDEAVKAIADEHGVEYVVYKPKWLTPVPL